MMNDIFEWFMVMANNKSVTLVIFVVTFTAILIYVYGSKKRSARFEEYRNIPFLDDDQDERVSGSTKKILKDTNTTGEK